MNEALGSQVGAAGLAVFLIEWLKSHPSLKWITATTDRLNRFLSALLAALATVGIAAQFDAQQGVLVISGLQLSSILTLLWNFVIQWVLQETIYKGAVKK